MDNTVQLDKNTYTNLTEMEYNIVRELEVFLRKQPHTKEQELVIVQVKDEETFNKLQEDLDEKMKNLGIVLNEIDTRTDKTIKPEVIQVSGEMGFFTMKFIKDYE